MHEACRRSEMFTPGPPVGEGADSRFLGGAAGTVAGGCAGWGGAPVWCRARSSKGARLKD